MVQNGARPRTPRRRRVRPALTFGLFGAALTAGSALSCTPATTRPTPAATATKEPPSPPTVDQVLAHTLPGVVLLIARRSDGKLAYGAGVLLDDAGLVLTNVHVVAHATSIGGLLYDGTRTSYTPQDGGLARFLFEYEKQVVPGHLVRGDPVMDLAVVKLDANTSKYEKLPFRDLPPRLGEPVLALGHPAESVWSFSQGVVSSLHHGAIQTDAAINPGNSGGPLIDLRGQVIGINTSRAETGTDRVGFARPWSLVHAFLDDSPRAAVTTVDLSTPEKAVETCLRAGELGDRQFLRCIDWESAFAVVLEQVRRVARLGVPASQRDGAFTQGFVASFHRKKPEVLAAMKHEIEAGVTGEAYVDESVTFEFDGGGKKQSQEFVERMQRVQKDALLAANVQGIRRDLGDASAEPAYDAKEFARTGRKLPKVPDPNASGALRSRQTFDLLRLGFRLEGTQAVDGRRAWVIVAGRNADSTPWRYSELVVRVDGAWLFRDPPLPEDEATRPRDFPPSRSDYASEVTPDPASWKMGPESAPQRVTPNRAIR